MDPFLNPVVGSVGHAPADSGIDPAAPELEEERGEPSSDRNVSAARIPEIQSYELSSGVHGSREAKQIGRLALVFLRVFRDARLLDVLQRIRRSLIGGWWCGIGRFEPCLVPEYQALSLTAGMGGTVTSNVSQMVTALDRTDSGLLDGVAGFVRTALHFDLPTTELSHLGHERDAIEAALFIERGCDLVERPNADSCSGLHFTNPIWRGAGPVGASSS
jgi:hypothetical protein